MAASPKISFGLDWLHHFFSAHTGHYITLCTSQSDFFWFPVRTKKLRRTGFEKDRLTWHSVQFHCVALETITINHCKNSATHWTNCQYKTSVTHWIKFTVQNSYQISVKLVQSIFYSNLIIDSAIFCQSREQMKLTVIWWRKASFWQSLPLQTSV